MDAMNKSEERDSNLQKSMHAQAREQDKTDLLDIEARMDRVKHTIMVLSGKGGVGKSTVAVNLAVSLAIAGKKVGLLDIDIHGPSVPQMLNLTGKKLKTTGDALIPVNFTENLKVISMGLLLEERDEAVIWRGPLKMKMIKQFLKDVDWGELDYMIVDSPPGTGDEPLSIAQLLPKADGAIIVTTPQQISVADVRRCINFCHKLSLKVLGVVENMSGFVCPTCGTKIDLFSAGGGADMAADMSVPFLGSIPIDKAIVDACDNGEPYMLKFADSEAGKAFNSVVEKLNKIKEKEAKTLTEEHPIEKMDDQTVRIALPIVNGKLCAHFGHCDSFALLDVDKREKTIKHSTQLPSPGHQPGVLPGWLHEQGANIIITGGMGSRAVDLFTQNGIEVIMGAMEDTPERIVQSYLEGSLVAGQNVCDH